MMDRKKIIITSVSVLLLVLFFFITKTVSPDMLKEMGLEIPLPVFTFIIALVDGFNPCNLFVLTLLLSLMLSESHSRKKIFAVGYSFIIVVYAPILLEQKLLPVPVWPLWCLQGRL